LAPEQDSHRGRARERELQRENLQALLNATSGAEFWKLVRGWTDPKPRTALVTAGQLRGVFEQRLNPPNVLPEHFNVEQHEWNSFMAGKIPETTFDRIPNLSFTRPFTIADIEKIKVRLRKHEAKSA
ncbi:hypothetical protein K438DRAFT_1430448, partial [Mycena galopus ATCC 62051]